MKMRIPAGVTALLAASVLVPPSAGAAPGDPDPAFAGGFVDATPYGPGVAVAVGPDGHVVVGIEEATLIRLTPDGRRDDSFSDDGELRIGAAGDAHVEVRGLAVDRRGRIFVAGELRLPFGGSHLLVLRYRSDGRADRSFGRRGRVTVRTGRPGLAEARGVDLQPDGRILVAGYGTPVRSSRVGLVLRLLPSGRRDRSFGSRGAARLPLWGRTVRTRSDGTVFVGGDGVVREGYAVARLDRRGRRVAKFGKHGVAFAGQAGSRATALAVQRDGRVLLGGPEKASGRAFILHRFTRHGRLDPSFDSDGRVTTQLGEATAYEWPWSELVGVGLQPDGRIVAGGTASAVAEGQDYPAIALARYLPDGRLDPSFGSGGSVVTHPPNSRYAETHGFAMQRDGRPVLTGDGFDAARFLP